MDTPPRDLESQQSHDQKTPLLDPSSNTYHSNITKQPSSSNPSSTSSSCNRDDAVNNAMSNVEAGLAKAFKSTADLAKHLPTGCVLIFQILSPVFTNQGECDDVNRSMTIWLVAMCSLVVFFLNFTDSFVDSGNNVCYTHLDFFY
jgi:Protein of unknown function (DUF679)